MGKPRAELFVYFHKDHLRERTNLDRFMTRIKGYGKCQYVSFQVLRLAMTATR